MREGREQREWMRIAVNMPAKCRLIDGAARYEATRVTDIHHQGGCLEGAQYFRKGARIRIILEIPFEGQVSFTAEAAWSVPINAEGDYRTGLKFIIDGPLAEDNCNKLYHYCLLRQPRA